MQGNSSNPKLWYHGNEIKKRMYEKGGAVLYLFCTAPTHFLPYIWEASAIWHKILWKETAGGAAGQGHLIKAIF
jgi:hypothetical protein